MCQHAPMTSDTVSLRAAAEQLGLHYMTVYRYVRTGRLPAVKQGGQWYVDPADLDALTVGSDPASRDGSRARAARQLEDRMLAADESGAWTVISQALTSGAEPADIHLQMIIPAMQSIGRRWADGEITVFDEHQATAVATRLTARLGPRFHRRGAPSGHIVVGLVSGDTHALTSAIIADLLRGRGFEVTDLGADTPTESFAEIIDQPRTTPVVAVAISSGADDHLPQLVATARELRAGHPDLAIALGGPGLRSEEDARAAGATIWAPDVEGLIKALGHLLNP